MEMSSLTSAAGKKDSVNSDNLNAETRIMDSTHPVNVLCEIE